MIDTDNSTVERTIEIVLINDQNTNWPTRVSIRADGKEIAFSKRWATNEQIIEGLLEHLGVDVEALKEKIREKWKEQQ